MKDLNVIVIDTSSHSIRAGKPLGELFLRPSVDIPARVGLRRQPEADGDAMQIDAPKLRPSSYLVGKALDDALAAGDDVDVSWPWEGGDVRDWVGAEALWKHTLGQLLPHPRSAPALVLVSIPTSLSKRSHERITQIFFERLNVPALTLIERPVLGIYAAGATSGVVVDLGWDTLDVVPVSDTVVQHHAAVQWPIGVRDLEAYIVHLLRSDDKLLASPALSALSPDALTAALRDIVHTLFTTPDALNAQAASAGAEPEGAPENLDIAAALVSGKEKSIVAAAQAKKKGAAADDPVEVRVDVAWRGETVSVGPLRNRFFEPLFDPSLLIGVEGVEQLPVNKRIPLQEAVYNVVGKCEPELRPKLWEGLVFAGSLAAVPGFSALLPHNVARLLPPSETSDLQPSAANLKLLKVPDYFAEFKGRDDLNMFLGASIVAKIANADQAAFAITKIQYNAKGPAVVHLAE